MQHLEFSGRRLCYTDIGEIVQAAGCDIGTYPYVIRVLLENLCRHRVWSCGLTVADHEVANLLDWKAHVGADLPLHVTRVILPDSSGLPVLQDLAALRDAVAREGGDVASVNSCVPVDVVVDHSLQVDHWGSKQALKLNMRREFERNDERYRFLKWARQAFTGLTVHPPGTGIIHQVNLEQIASVVAQADREEGTWAFPDFVIGGDSHTPMVNALGVLGWGVGGIDAEAAMLGHAYTFPVPEVVGVRLVGRIEAPAMTTDAALLINQQLRGAGVTGCMVEFFGPAVARLSIPERATISNMAPEYGATCGFFAVDPVTLGFLRATGRSDMQVGLVEAYCRRNHLFHTEDAVKPAYSRVIEIDLSLAVPSIAGPSRPQDRMPLSAVPSDFHARLARPVAAGGFGEPDGKESGSLRHGSIVMAAITSCTNTSNPSVMLAAGLVARKAVELGLSCPAWVKTSLAPGSRAVTAYLEQADLLAPLEALGFSLIGYGCTTCGGKSGPLPDDVVAAIEKGKLVTTAILSGNRNFEGRIHKLIRANYIGSPPLVVAYALAGRIDIDFEREPIGRGTDGLAVYLRDLWPDSTDIARLLPLASNPALFVEAYAAQRVPSEWDALDAPTGARFAWAVGSSYLVEPPFFRDIPPGDPLLRLEVSLKQAHVLAAFGDSLTTDHISPGGEIPVDTPAGQYLTAKGITPRDFNSYVSRRCNFEVMTRATLANIRLRNMLVPGVEGGVTRYFPDGGVMSIFDAAASYRSKGMASLLLAGKDYGTGSSRDWAAKGLALLGVKAVIAESFERIHRANLVGMGVLPLAFAPGEGWRQLGLDGSETYSLSKVAEAVRTGGSIEVVAVRVDGTQVRFAVRPQVLTAAERQLMIEGGMPASVLRHFRAA